ncbi:protein PROTON GRADIENT REGULATION 5, chloroplastic isoform X1 [Typha angustifolia]|uniref:protein PROTON GRADIENT REGULATION 5, chloroplastic isoform X1 n=1 Tax=Typha angustifolia TaxID=59011 RepID=UPI003C2C8838
MATSLSAALPSSLHASCTTSLAGEDRGVLVVSVPARAAHARPIRSRPRMGNVNEGKGLFAPIVVVARNLIGRKRFNQLRGKAIALHSQMGVIWRIAMQVITEFCKTIGADSKQRQGLIRLAKKNGEKLGFLA